MKHDNTRFIAVKSLFSADEYQALKDACDEHDIPHSRLLRELARWWIEWMKNKSVSIASEVPESGHNMASFPIWFAGCPFPLRL